MFSTLTYSTIHYIRVRVWFLFSAVRKNVDVTHLARCVTFRRQSPNDLSMSRSYTIGTLPAADSHSVAGYHKDTERTVWAMLSVHLYPKSSGYCSWGEAILEHWDLQMFQLTLNWNLKCCKLRKGKKYELIKLLSVCTCRLRLLCEYKRRSW